MLPAQNPALSGRRARRPRTIQACNLCRFKKYKCDGNIPCSHCRKHGMDCVFRGAESSSTNGPGYSIGYVKQLERKLEAAEAALRSVEASPRNNTYGQVSCQNQPQQCSQREHMNEQSNRDDGVEPVGGTNLPPAPSALSSAGPPDFGERSCGTTSPLLEEMSDCSNDEVMDINVATQSFEFHGQTSSLAFLERLQKDQEQSAVPISHAQTKHNQRQSLVNELQDDAHTQRRSSLESSATLSEDYYSLHAYAFLDAYFKTLHFIYPILDQHVFLDRCHDLWKGNASHLPQSFTALYFSLLALGALTRTWTEKTINGLGRLEWTHLLFKRAEKALGRPGRLQDLEAVQAPFFLSLVCQNQLNPNLAYTYLGTAISTAFSTGINRMAIFRDKNFPQDSPSLTVSRTWWALYSLEIELSFTLGRPDMLGSDVYHNRPAPPIGDTEISIIPAMLCMSRAMREVSASMYLRRAKLTDKLERANRIEHNLDDWIAQLPPKIRPNSDAESYPTSGLLDPYWPTLQTLVLRIRYLHVKMVLFYPFFLRLGKLPRAQNRSTELVIAAEKCKDAAVAMIKIIHWTYSMHHLYRTWWYNTTYVAFGVSVLLSHIARKPFPTRQDSEELGIVEQSLEILTVMEECTVARKIREYAREVVTLLRSDSDATDPPQSHRYPAVAQSTAFADFNNLLSAHGAELDHSFSGFNFYDGGFATLQADMENPHGLGNIESFEPNGWVD